MDSNYSLNAVKQSAKQQGYLAAMMVLVGFTFFTPSMNAGGQLGIGLDLKTFVFVLTLGNLFLAIYCSFLAFISQKTGLNIDLLAKAVFGKKGSIICSIIISFTQVGWFGVGLAMFAIPVAKITNIPLIYLIILSGICFSITSFIGMRAIAFIGSLAVIFVAVLGFYSTYYGINQVGGIDKIFRMDNEISLNLAFSIVIGSFISGGTSVPNFTRFSKTPKIAVLSVFVAFFIGNSLMMVFGAVGSAVSGKADIFDVLIMQGLMIPAVISLGFNIWSTLNNSLYTAGIGAANIFKQDSKLMIAILGLIGTASSVVLYNNFVPYLSFLSAIIPPIGAVIVMHFYFVNKNLDKIECEFNFIAIFAVIIGVLCGIFLPFGITALNSLLSSALIYLIIRRIYAYKKCLYA